MVAGKPEILAPAGNLEKLQFALIYGADAVYLGGENYGLRAAAGNFTLQQMKEGISFAHLRNKKVYVTVNIFAHNRDLINLPDYLEKLASLQVDGIIVSDPGIFEMVINLGLKLPVHISTQANATNWSSVKFWQRQGAERIVLARELSLKEVSEIKKHTDLELEAFVHGAMCISYSGRCLLSSYFTGRSANLGACTHPCRWKYYLMEEKRPGEYFPIEEDQQGAYIISSKDLCMIEHLPELAAGGLSSWKIEGRMKSIHYIATVVKTYRQALDSYWRNPDEYEFRQHWWQELIKVSDRGFTTGFYLEPPGPEDHHYDAAKQLNKSHEFVGIVLNNSDQGGKALIEQRNRFKVGDILEVFGPTFNPIRFQLEHLEDDNGQKIEAAPHSQQKVRVFMPHQVETFSLVRRLISSE